MTGRIAIPLLSHYNDLGRTELSFSKEEYKYFAEKYSNADETLLFYFATGYNLRQAKAKQNNPKSRQDKAHNGAMFTKKTK